MEDNFVKYSGSQLALIVLIKGNSDHIVKNWYVNKTNNTKFLTWN